MLFSRLGSQSFEVLLSSAEKGIDFIPVRQIESNCSIDLFECQGGKGFNDPLRRLTTKERVYYRIKRHT
jgi:hypothetical protein